MFRPGDYLVENTDVSYAPCATTLQCQRANYASRCSHMKSCKNTGIIVKFEI